MNEKISGITVPDSWVKRLEGVPAGKAKDVCVEMTSEFLLEVAPMCQGVHFMPLGWSDVVPRIIESAIK